MGHNVAQRGTAGGSERAQQGQGYAALVVAAVVVVLRLHVQDDEICRSGKQGWWWRAVRHFFRAETVGGTRALERGDPPEAEPRLGAHRRSMCNQKRPR